MRCKRFGSPPSVHDICVLFQNVTELTIGREIFRSTEKASGVRHFPAVIPETMITKGSSV